MVNFIIGINDKDVKEEDIIKTIFKVSDKEDLSNPIIDVTLNKGDASSLLALVDNTELVNGKTYYGTASYITTNGGLSFTSGVTSFVAKDTLDVELDIYLPTKTPLPELTSPYPRTSSPSKGFNVSMTPYTMSLNKHYATTWVLIRLLDNVIIETHVLDTDNINTLFFTSELLPGAYEVKARRHMVSGNDSLFASYIFTVRDPVSIFEQFGLAIDITNTVYANLELDKVSVISDTDNLGMKVYSNGEVKRSSDISAGLTDVMMEENATVQIYIKDKEESSLYLYSLLRFPGSCRFQYTLPIDFC